MTNSSKRKFDKIGMLKFGITTLFFIDFVRRVLNSAILLNSTGMIISTIFVSALALLGLVSEFDSTQLHNKARAEQFTKNEEFQIILTFTFASIATYLGTVLFNVNMTLAASVVVLAMVSLIPAPFPIFQATVYTGTFTGMVSDQFITNWPLALLFGFVGSILFLFFQPSYRATGGRAGLNAYMTSFIFIFAFDNVKTSIGKPLHIENIAFSFAFLIGSAFTAYLLKENSPLSGVQSAMLITLLLNIFIPDHLGVLISAGFMGSFMGTTGSDRIKSLGFLFLVEFFAFLLFVPAYPLLAGLGGKLGMVTLMGYLAADGVTSLVAYSK